MYKYICLKEFNYIAFYVFFDIVFKALKYVTFACYQHKKVTLHKTEEWKLLLD